MKHKLLVLLFLIPLAGCATPVQHPTPSGKPEVIINKTNVKTVRNKVSEFMINYGYRPVRSDDMTAVFDKIINDGGMINLMMGSQYDMNPAARVTYTFLEQGKAVRVIADIAVITNPGSGYERRNDYNHHPDSLLFQQELNLVKNRLEGR